MTLLNRLAARVLGTPLMVEHARLETILSVIGPRVGIEVGAIPPGFEKQSDSQILNVTPNGIAIVPIHGTLVKRAGSIDAASGLLSYAATEEMILEAATDPAVKAILLDIDSPGGEVGGVFDLAAMIQEAGEAKPVWAVADDAFSAAYMLAASTQKIYLPSTAGIGSIGVIAVHVDESERDRKEGRKYTTVFAGAQKNDFNSHQPLSDDARNRLNGEVSRLYGMFVGAVASGRKMDESAVRATEAGLYFGTNAVAVGLADQVGTIRDALTDLSAIIDTPRKLIVQRAAQSPDQPHLETTMPKDETQATEELFAHTPDSPPQKTAEAIDLDKVRAEKEVQIRGEAQTIVDLCALAGLPNLSGEFIAQGKSPEVVRKELLARQASGDEIHSHVMPGDGTRISAETSLTNNPLVAACQRLTNQPTMEG